MPKVFDSIDKIRPVYNWTYKIVMILCKIMLIFDILITTYTVIGRYVPFIKSPAWGEEIVLTLMSYMAVLSAALAIRRNAHIRMTAFDRFLPPVVLKVLDLVADAAVLAFGIIMLTVGWKYAANVRGTYISLPTVSKFWMYFPIPLAGIAMIIFEVEKIYEHLKAFWVKEYTGEEKEV